MQNINNKIRLRVIDDEYWINYNDLFFYISTLHDERYTITSIASEYGMSAVKLNKILKDLKIQYRKNGGWHIRAKYINKGYVESRCCSNKCSHMYWTLKGKHFIEDLMTANGYKKTKEEDQ